MDWRLGRMVRSVVKRQVINNGATFLIPADSQRVGITFLNNDSVNVYYVAPGDVGTAAQLGTDLGVAAERHFTIATHGDLPMGMWTFYNNDGAPDTFLWVEYYMPERVLAAANDYLKREGFFN